MQLYSSEKKSSALVLPKPDIEKCLVKTNRGSSKLRFAYLSSYRERRGASSF